MKIQTKELVSVWAMSESSQERKQLTLRLDLDNYANLHALKELFNKPVNEMINDLIKVGLEEVISNLPVDYWRAEEIDEDMASCGIRPGEAYGPKCDFQRNLIKVKHELVSLTDIKEVA